MLYFDLLPDLITEKPPRHAEGFYTSEVEHPRNLPVHTFLPTGYEPGYAYPLLVFFHGNGSDEEEVLSLAPRLSRRNYICISLRGLRPVDIHPDGRLGYSWGADDAYDVQLEDYVFEALEQTCDKYPIHPDRIYLAGLWEGASLAYRLALSFPEKFAGIISLNGVTSRRGRPLLRLPEVKKLQMFVGHGIANALAPISLARDDCRLLYNAGLNVDFRTYPTNHRLHGNMLKDVNRWIIDGCNQADQGLYAR